MTDVEITPDLLAGIRARAEKATPGPWTVDRWGCVVGGDGLCVACETPEADAAHIAGLDPSTVLALVDEIERLRESEREARADRDSIRRRLRLLTDDESWWIGGAWGDYGEAVIPIRGIHMVLGDVSAEVPETTPGLAATYRDLRATVEDQGHRLDAVRALIAPVVADLTGGGPDQRTHWDGCHRWHMGCLALKIQAVLDGAPTTDTEGEHR